MELAKPPRGPGQAPCQSSLPKEKERDFSKTEEPEQPFGFLQGISRSLQPADLCLHGQRQEVLSIHHQQPACVTGRTDPLACSHLVYRALHLSSCCAQTKINSQAGHELSKNVHAGNTRPITHCKSPNSLLLSQQLTLEA